MKKTFLLVVAMMCVLFGSAQIEQSYDIPLVGNTYVNNVIFSKDSQGGPVAVVGDWVGKLILKNADKSSSETYVYFVNGQNPNISLVAKGNAKVEVKGLEKAVTIKINSSDWKEYKLGTYESAKDGYMKLEMKLKDASGAFEAKNLVVTNLTETPVYLKETYKQYYGLRGPSCHLNYSENFGNQDLEWAVIDVMVPAELDRTSSYYMALGFDGGYFGFQNNSERRRQVLFSVWNTQHSDNPNSVEKKHQTEVVSKGENVKAQNFGGEGSGKQSFTNVMWQPDKVYRFLLHAVKVDATTTDYSGYFYDSVNDKWIYLSTLRRPNTKILIRGLHSFLENFSPEMGNVTRKGYYFNGWAKPVGGDWLPITKARLTCDDTGRFGQRLDFKGGVEVGKFFLTNCGYFDRAKEIPRQLEINMVPGVPPSIDLSQFKH